MQVYTEDNLIDEHGAEAVEQARIIAQTVAQLCDYAVWEFDKAPDELRAVVDNDDADWLTATRNLECLNGWGAMPHWLEMTDVTRQCPKAYQVGGVLVLVGYHA